MQSEYVCKLLKHVMRELRSSEYFRDRRTINGQTGKMVGDLPLDRFAFWKSVLIRTALIAGLLYTLMYLVVI